MNRNGDLLTPGEVGDMLRVDTKTVAKWAQAGRLSSVRTPGGHRRFRRAEIEILRGDIPAGSEPAGMPSRNGIVLTCEDVEIIRAALRGLQVLPGRQRIRNMLGSVGAGSIIKVIE